jgi:hypothetical protein
MKDLLNRYGHINYIVIDVSTDKLPTLFQNAREEGLMNHYYRYFLTSLVTNLSP